MRRILVIGLCLAGLGPPPADAKEPARAAPVRIVPIQRFSGVLKDESLRTVLKEELGLSGPGVLTYDRELEPLWKKWRGKGKMPQIDFIHNLAVVVASPAGVPVPVEAVVERVGSEVKVSIRMAKKGAVGLGFGYEIAIVPRQGIKTFAGNRLPCGRYNCDCHELHQFNPETIETLALAGKLEGVCWGELAQYECYRNDKAEHKRMLDAAFADSARSNKILLYIANTGG